VFALAVLSVKAPDPDEPTVVETLPAATRSTSYVAPAAAFQVIETDVGVVAVATTFVGIRVLVMTYVAVSALTAAVTL